MLADKSVLYKNLVKHKWRYAKGLFFLIIINILQDISSQNSWYCGRWA